MIISMSDVSSTSESQSRTTEHEQGAESHQDRGEEIEMTVIRQDVAGLKEKEAAIEHEADSLQNSNTSNNVQIESGCRSLTNGRHKLIKKGRACCKNFNWRRLELIAMIVTAVIACGLLTLPTIFYHIPRSQSSEQNPMTPTDENCLPVVSETCKNTLAQLQKCLPDKEEGSEEVYISSAVPQTETEDLAVNLINGLSFLSPSPECLEIAEPFLCLYLFPLCDNTATYHPTYNECVVLTTDVCQSEWERASLLSNDLPQCSDFEDVPTLCSSVNMNSSSNDTFPVVVDNNVTSSTINCSDHFFSQNGFCFPICKSWPGSVNSIVRDAMAIIATSIGIIAGTTVLIISCLRWRRMCVFPSVLVIYMTITVMLFAPLILISFVDREALYCSSKNLIESVQSATVFCDIAGSAFYYTLLQLSLWWFCHVASLFWKVVFPFHSKIQEKSHRIKYIHAGIVLLAILVPFVTVAASMGTGGFTITSFPPLLCASKSADVAFYALVFPISILMAIGIVMLLVVLWTIRKHQIFIGGKNPRKHQLLGPAEKKVIIVFLYYIVLVSVALVAFTLDVRKADEYVAEVTKYFICESKGNGSCSTSGYEDLTNPEISNLAIFLLGLFPAANLVYALNINELKSIIYRWLGIKKKSKFTELSSATTKTTQNQEETKL